MSMSFATPVGLALLAARSFEAEQGLCLTALDYETMLPVARSNSKRVSRPRRAAKLPYHIGGSVADEPSRKTKGRTGARARVAARATWNAGRR